MALALDGSLIFEDIPEIQTTEEVTTVRKTIGKEETIVVDNDQYPMEL